MTIAEAVELLHNYEIECSEKDVRQWITEGEIEATENGADYNIKEQAVLSFLVDLSYVGTAYEKGINDETKIVRLEEKVGALQKEIDKLRCEKLKLELKSGSFHFNG
ncbi:helix-turn-helix domain-containing protein [Shouchella shacheensis]|uniref:helix-turn-helix domain-containing protein n=1 Tax=Shouchella shacheensis TaxID=1649580 RepID=UPI0012FBE338|nr:helix-turn-helix domain-containing protein [Shouchella shacheensis]